MKKWKYVFHQQRYMSVICFGCGLGRQGGHNWQKYFICLFHVSEHVDHFKARFFYIFFNWKMIPRGTHPPTPIGKFQLDFLFCFEALPKAQLVLIRVGVGGWAGLNFWPLAGVPTPSLWSRKCPTVTQPSTHWVQESGGEGSTGLVFSQGWTHVWLLWHQPFYL